MKGKLLTFRRGVDTPEALSDAALVAACAIGDTAALGALFDRHHAATHRFLGRLSGTDDRDLDDLVQATFVEVQRGAGRFSAGGAVRSWIFGIAVNVTRHHVRAEVRRRATLACAGDLPQRRPEQPEELAQRRQEVALLQRALAGLPHELREAWVLSELEDFAGADAARALGLGENTFWRRLHQARVRLRAALQGDTP